MKRGRGNKVDVGREHVFASLFPAMDGSNLQNSVLYFPLAYIVTFANRQEMIYVSKPTSACLRVHFCSFIFYSIGHMLLEWNFGG
jgi:hypothetical protein